MSAPAARLPSTATAARNGRWLRRNAWTIGVYLLLVLLLIADKIVHPSLNAFDIQSLVDGALPLALAGMAQAAVVLGGGIDLSVGSMMSLMNVISAQLMASADLKASLGISLLLMVLGAGAGVINGLLITITRVPDIIVTLGMSFIWGGIALVIMPTPGGGVSTDYASMVTGYIGSTSIPSGLLVLLAVVAVIWLPFRRSRAGLAIYAIGSNRNAAFLSGVSVARTRIIAYALGAVFATLGGLALTATTSNGSALSGQYYTLNSVAAIVLGGVSLAGGRGGMLGALAASFVLILITTILTLMGIDQNWSQVIQGTLIILVVMFGGLVLVRRQT